jgi:hypothetical protein
MAVATSTNANPNGLAAVLQRRPNPKHQAKIAPSKPSLAELDAATPASEDEASTVLYLAYGSNLCAETFRGKRGIKPLSHVNVYVPQLEFNLRLPGVPYLEPCFANVHFREPHTSVSGESDLNPVDPSRYSDEQWDGGLMGVVYEVTQEDYRQIIRTEGGGSGYKEIKVSCIPLQPDSSSTSAKPIFARTLYAAPDPPLDAPNATPRKEPWWKRMFGGRGQYRPDLDRAQASARYLKLITDGAREHQLPAVYQRYLASLQPYTVTTLRQQVGRAATAIIAGPILLSMMAIAKRLADEDGKYPKPVARAMTAVFNIIWAMYDHVTKPLFGDGERTESGKGSMRPVRGPSLMAQPEIMTEEKLELLGE